MASTDAVDGVVVGTDDGSANSDVTLDFAADEARRRGVGLHILHAYPWIAEARLWDFEPPREELERAEELVEAAAQRVRARSPELAVTTEVVVQDPVVALVEASSTVQVVVVGAGRATADDRHLGRVAEAVVAHAHSPVIVVRRPPDHPEGPVVVGVDPRDVAPEALEYAHEEAVRRGTGLVVVQGLQSEGLRRAWENLGTRSRVDALVARAEKHTRERLREWRERLPAVPADLQQVRDDPVDALTAASATASIVVVGSHGRGNLIGLLLGSVSRGVLRRVPVVAVVPSPDEPRDDEPRD